MRLFAARGKVFPSFKDLFMMRSARNAQKTEDHRLIIRRLEELCELAILCVIYFLVWEQFYREPGLFIYNYFGRGKFVLMFVYAILAYIVLHMNEGFRFGYLKLSEVTISQWMGLLIVNFITYFQLCLTANVMLNPGPMFVLMFIEMPVSFLLVYIFTFIYHHSHVPYNMLMIYGNEKSVGLKLKMDSRQDRYHITKIVPAQISMRELAGLIPSFDAVIIADIPAEKRNDILKFCYANSIRAYLTPKISDVIQSGSTSINLFDTPLQLVRGVGLSIGNRAVKRFFDVFLSGLALVVLSPLFAGIAIAIKLEDGGSVFYRQRRVTLNGKEFDILKFRSMIEDAEKDQRSHPATEDDPRITKVGRFIRGCRMDELPQLINIIKGDMSIVGPRPERVEHVRKYAEEVPEFVLRLKVKGGLTGYAQVYGKYNTTPLDKLKLDLMYIENYSLMLDFKLILMTVRVLFQKESTEGFDKQLTQQEIRNEIKKSRKQEKE